MKHYRYGKNNVHLRVKIYFSKNVYLSSMTSFANDVITSCVFKNTNQ